MGGNEESRALPQDHHLLEQEWMQESASASLAFPKREAKALPSVQGLEGAAPVSRRKNHKIPVGSGKFCHVGPQEQHLPTNCTRSMGTKRNACAFLHHTLGPPTHPKSPKNPQRTPVVTGAALPYLCSAGYWFSDIIFGMWMGGCGGRGTAKGGCCRCSCRAGAAPWAAAGTAGAGGGGGGRPGPGSAGDTGVAGGVNGLNPAGGFLS